MYEGELPITAMAVPIAAAGGFALGIDQLLLLAMVAVAALVVGARVFYLRRS